MQYYVFKKLFVKTGHGCYYINRVVNVGITEVRLEQKDLKISGDSTVTVFHNFAIFHLKDIYSTLSLKRRRQWHPTPVLLPRISHGQRSRVGCSPWGR